jgi:hypothetical protein
MLRTRGHALLLLITLLLVPACGADPPEKELQQAQSAIDAARTAGANDYAHGELAAAEQALKNAREAVDDRDYRLALTSALDSRARAENASTQAADQKAAAHTAAEKLLGATSTALARAHGRLKTASAARPAPRNLSAIRRTLETADRDVQEARTTFAASDYPATIKTLKDVNARLTDVERDLEASSPAPARRKH